MSNSESPVSMNEHLSALIDDEVGSFEERRVLDELKSDNNLSKKLSNYALIGETMRTGDTEKPVLSLGSGFLDGIHEKIALEEEFTEVIIESDVNSHQTTHSNTQSSSFSWLRPVGGFAVAASVGAFAFMGLQNAGMLSSPNSQPSGIVDNNAPTAIVQSAPLDQSISVVTADSVTASSNEEYMNADAQTRSMLKRYVDSHMQYATTSTFVPSVRAIAYTDNQ